MKGKIRGIVLILLGVVCIAAALVLVEKNLTEERTAGDSAESVLKILSETITQTAQAEKTAADDPDAPEEVPDYEINPQIKMPNVTIDGEKYIGILTLHGLKLALPVMNSWSYPKLRKAPCRYYGSVYEKNMVICAHNYGRHFGRLRDIPIGSEVDFTDADGNVFRYIVDDVVSLRPRDSKRMKSGEYPLTLFTCTVGGATRVTVRCIEMDETM